MWEVMRMKEKAFNSPAASKLLTGCNYVYLHSRCCHKAGRDALGDIIRGLFYSLYSSCEAMWTPTPRHRPPRPPTLPWASGTLVFLSGEWEGGGEGAVGIFTTPLSLPSHLHRPPSHPKSTTAPSNIDSHLDYESLRD